MTIRVLTALTDSAFDEVVLRRLSRADSGATVVRRCVDVVELRSAASAGVADVAVIDGRLRGLDRDALTELHGRGVRVVLVVAAPESSPMLGGDAVIPPDAELVVSSLRGGVTGPPPRAIPDAVSAAGRVVAVWGPQGCPGRTTVAIGLADEGSRLGVSSLLLDGDTYGASIGQHLGLLSDSSGLAAACRMAGQGRLDGDALRQVGVMLPSGLAVLTGLARPNGWDELRPAAVDSTLQVAREAFALTVVDVGFCVEHDPLTWFEPGTPSRNQAAVALLGAADVVVAVSGADPVSLVRMFQSLPDVTGLAPTAQLHLVINKVPRNRATTREIEQLVSEHARVEPTALLSWDLEATAAALRDGRTLAESAPRCVLRQQLRSLAGRILAVPVSGRRRRVA